MGSDANAAVRPYRLEGIELASALVFGVDRTIPPLDITDPAPPLSPRGALEVVLIDALERPPCVIGFSGGRDSSTLLALAAHVARREGLDPPIAATNVFPGDVQAAESEWQELLIRHAGVEDWHRLAFDDELDVVGPVAAPLLRRFGPTFPFNGHFGMPSMALATGGTYLTGVGGDEVFEPDQLSRVAYVLSGKVRPRRSDLRAIAAALGPEALRVRRWKHLLTPEPWLHADVGAQLLEDLAGSLSRHHLWFDRQVTHDIWRERAMAAMAATLGAFGALLDVTVVHPFLELRFLRSVAASRGRTGWPSRSAALNELVGDLLPMQVVERTTKATFDTVFCNHHCRQFVARWDGRGVDTDLVDLDRLRSAWMAPEVDPRSLSLLQAAWLHDQEER